MMIDRYIDKRTLIHLWDPRFKLITLFLFTFVCASVEKAINLLLISAFALTLLLISKLPLKHILHSLKFPVILLLLMFPMFLLSSGGEVLVSFGIIDLYMTGLNKIFIISIRVISIIMIFTVLFSTSRLNIILRTMEYYKIPETVTGIFLFTYRYIFTFMEDSRKISAAANIRGYRFSKGLRHFLTTVNILVSMIIRSFEQSERTYQALILRGYTGKNRVLNKFQLRKADIIITLLVAITAVVILIIEQKDFIWKLF